MDIKYPCNYQAFLTNNSFCEENFKKNLNKLQLFQHFKNTNSFNKT